MKYGIHPAPEQLPPLFRQLSLPTEEIYQTSDGFFAATRSLAQLLTDRDIDTFPNSQGEQRRCDLFFDDWYLYCVSVESGFCYSLFKMREQEYNAQRGETGDGDTPGVTVCFIEFHTEAFARCLEDPTPRNRSEMNGEVNRVVASRGQRHTDALKAYFRRPQAQAPYLIGELYVHFIAGLAQDGFLPVPIAYAQQYSRNPHCRLARFLEENNAGAGDCLCDHTRIIIRNPEHPTKYEALAILATHTADTSLHCFAAEVRYHACYLFPLARIPIPFLGRSVYDSAIRADLTIGESELEGPAPFHNPRSRWVKLQQRFHTEEEC